MRSMWIWAQASLVCIVVAWAAVTPAAARAQESPHDAEAHAYFEAGRLAFGDGRYDEALTAFRRAYELSQRGQLLYNIGQCYDRMRRDQEALAAFQQFLAADPDSTNAAEVRARVAFLERAVADSTVATSTDPVPTDGAGTPPSVSPEPSAAEPSTIAPPSDAGPRGDAGPAPWILLGTGGALAIGGAVLVGLGFSNVSTVENAPAGTPYASVRDADQQATPFIGAGFAGIGVGALLAVIGIVLATSSSGGSEHATVYIGPGGLELRGTF